MKKTNYYSITTPQGTGGIGIIELFGKDALETIGKIFRRAKNKTNEIASSSRTHNDTLKQGLNRIKPNRIYLGHIYTPSPYPLPRRERVNDEIIDEVIIHFTPAQNSLTKLDTVEINAHGGIMSCRLIGNLLKRFGVKEVSQDKIIDTAYKNRRLDLIQKEALKYLMEAKTPLASSVLLDQYNGALSKTLKSRKNMPELRESARYGIALTQPRRILILGRPNVGKSTLFNALLGQDRAITHHLPGTTRDTIEDVLAIEGFPFVLVDTAGLREKTKDAIEKIGIAYAKKEIPRADVVLLVTDTDNPKLLIRNPGKQEKESWLHGLLIKGNSCSIKSGKRTNIPVIIVRNKANRTHKLIIHNSGFIINPILVSALKRTGIDRLRKEILKACKLDNFKYKPSQAIIFTKKQMALIH
jgi:tRNA modification GTPase